MNSKLKLFVLNFLTATYGNAIVFLSPKKALQLSENGMTLVFSNSMSITERLMRQAILKKLEKSKDYNTLAGLHQNYWTNKGAEFFLNNENSFKNDFLPNCAFIFDELKKELLNSPTQFKTLVEIGTGNGRVLKYLSSKFPEINRFIGIDLSSAQIEINKITYQTQSNLEFASGDVTDWIKKHDISNTIFVTSKGVLEYFTEQKLQTFLVEINNSGPSIFVAIEPNDTHHNFVSNPNSIPYGHERSFSHNYPKLFKNAGFSMWHHSQVPSSQGSHLRTFIGART